MTESQQVRGRNTGPTTPAESRTPGPAAGGQEQVVAHHDAHGQSVASWTCVSIIMLGTLIMAVAVVVMTVWLFVLGAVVVVVGVIAGKVLSAMGFGVSGRPGH
jgi:hypothetical protein